MSNVNLAIGGRTFMVACADGEEGHIADLGRMIDDKVTASGAIAQNETRMLLFAALMLADEVHEVRSDLAQAQTLQAQGQQTNTQLQHRFDQVALRLEALAQELEMQHLEDSGSIS
jgi:cell division protein ZapA